MTEAGVAGGCPAAERDGAGALAQVCRPALEGARCRRRRSRLEPRRVAPGAVLVDPVARDVGRARTDRGVVVVAVGVGAGAVEVEVGVVDDLASGDGVAGVDRRRVLAEAAVDRVGLAVAGEDPVFVLAALEGVLARPAVDFVVALAALDQVGGGRADEVVPLLAAGEVLDIGVDVLVAAEAVVALIVEGDGEGFGRRQLIGDRIRAFAAVDRVGPDRLPEQVVAGAAVDRVRAGAAAELESVVVVFTVEDVGFVAADRQQILARARVHDQFVFAGLHRSGGRRRHRGRFR